MRAPPPLRWHCAEVRAWRAFTAAATSVAAASVAAWGLAHAEADPPWPWLGPLFAAVPALICGWHLAPARRGILEWTGTAWTWQSEGAAAAELRDLRLSIDLHSTLLLRLRAAAPFGAASRTAWVMVQRAQDPAQWPLLCALLHEGTPASPRRD
jgi:hypothetical protein